MEPCPRELCAGDAGKQVENELSLSAAAFLEAI